MPAPPPVPLTLTEDLVKRLPDRVEARGLPEHWPDLCETYHARTTARILASLPETGQLWIFAAGSLIWNPRCPVAERRVGRLRGWHRAFCLGPDTRYRGNPKAPGLMLTLDRGGQCDGVVMRMEPDGMAASLEALLRQEPPTPPSWVWVDTPQGRVRAIAFTLGRGHPAHAGRRCEAELADILSRAVGFVGSMPDYLLRTVTHLQAEGIHDRYLWRLQAAVAARLQALPPAR